MRRPLFVVMLAGSLLVGCSDQSPEAPSAPAVPGPELDVGPTGCSLNNLLDLTKALFPPSPTLNLVVATLKALPTDRQLRLSATIRASVFSIVDVVTKAYTANRLFGGQSPATQANVIAFINGLYCFVELPPPNISPGALDPREGAIAVVTPNSGRIVLQPASKHGGLIIPAQSVTTPTTVTISLLPANSRPLLTTLDQYPLFYEFSSSSGQVFTKDVVAAVCVPNTFETNPAFRLGHNVGSPFGAVEVLPLPPAGTALPVDCTTAFSAAPQGLRGMFASVFLPAELHAATLAAAAVGVGGTTRKFSPFGAVDPGSNPATITIVDQNGNPTTGTVEGPGTIFVKATSANGAPIDSVPVNFGGTTRTTGKNGNAPGVASFTWTAPPGSTLTVTVPNEAVGSGEGSSCPIPAPGPDSAYRPRVCFTPHAVTFTSVQTLPTQFGSSGWSYKQVANDAVVPSSWTTTGATAAEGWATAGAAFGQIGYCGLPPYNVAAPATPWTVGTTMLLRRDVSIPANTPSATIDVLVDNDIQVFVNGFEVTAGLVTHNGCANQTPLPGFTVQSSQSGIATQAAPLLPGQVNKIAIRGVDRGDQSYLDAKVTLGSQ